MHNPYVNEKVKYELSDYKVHVSINSSGNKREYTEDRRFIESDKSEIISLINNGIKKGFTLIDYNL